MFSLAVFSWHTVNHTRINTQAHTHTHGKLSFLYLRKMKVRKTSILLYHLQILAPRKPTSVVASLHLPNIFKMAVKLPQRDGVCCPQKYPPKKHTHVRTCEYSDRDRWIHWSRKVCGTIALFCNHALSVVIVAVNRVGLIQSDG